MCEKGDIKFTQFKNGAANKLNVNLFSKRVLRVVLMSIQAYICDVHRSFKIAAISVFSVLFYLLIGMNNSTPLSQIKHFEKQELPEKEDAISSDSKIFVSFVQRVQVNFSITPGSNLSKTFWDSLWYNPGRIERLSKISNARQVGYAKHILYRLKQIDMLFPFHHFW